MTRLAPPTSFINAPGSVGERVWHLGCIQRDELVRILIDEHDMGHFSFHGVTKAELVGMIAEREMVRRPEPESEPTEMIVNLVEGYVECPRCGCQEIEDTGECLDERGVEVIDGELHVEAYDTTSDPMFSVPICQGCQSTLCYPAALTPIFD